MATLETTFAGLKLRNPIIVIVRIRGHAHQSAYPDMIELSPFTGCQHFPAFVKAESKLGLFPGNVQLQQAVDSFFGFGSLLVHFGRRDMQCTLSEFSYHH